MISLSPLPMALALPIAAPVRLVSVETARAVRGVTAEAIFTQVEDRQSAQYLPAFDMNIRRPANGKRVYRRELRIWTGALREPGRAQAALEEIIADCLLTDVAGLGNANYHLHNSLLELAWCVSNETLLRMISEGWLAGKRVGRNWRVNRLSAANFLRARLVDEGL